MKRVSLYSCMYVDYYTGCLNKHGGGNRIGQTDRQAIQQLIIQ